MNYSLSIPNLKFPVTELPFGGARENGETLGINNRFMTKNKKPMFPIMGEFHFSRYPPQYWEESIRKMRSGGIRIVASYVFWIHHEEEKGKWNFSGQRDLRMFISLCSKLNLLFFLRIGPWAHGECRNGGFPDWLQHDKSIKHRSNDLKYLDLVRILYKKIFEEVKGLLWKEGGPVIGIQIENEHGHCGGVNGSEGLAHMSVLKKIALDAGFDVPYYTATGWGGANVVDGEMIPVQGGYADAPWEQHTRELPANQNYLLTPFQNDPLIGSDWGHSFETFTYRVKDYPYLTAELGGGIQVTSRRRPVITAIDTAAQALCKIASGAAMLGYYMYHGGTNPSGELTTLQESTESGSYTDVPVLSYDFQACIGEYGELHQSYRKLKRLHMFINDFEEILAPSVSFFPAEMVKDAEDTQTLRICARHDFDSNTGFLFINNHQRNRNMISHKETGISVELPNETIHFPLMNIPTGFYGIFPYNIDLSGFFLQSTNAQLLCKLKDKFVFFCHEKPVFNFKGEQAPVIVLTEEEADNAWLFGDQLYITKGDLIENENGLCITTCRTEETVIRFPDKKEIYLKFNKIYVNCKFTEVYRDDLCAEYELLLDKFNADGINDIFMVVDFTGDRAELYRDGKLAADWFTTGLPWRVGLRRFNYEGHFSLKIFPVVKDTYFECEIKEGFYLNNIFLETQYVKQINEEAWI
ncbi:MAG: beta-galactosidase [Treponema sp.]|nr:beta-galactosidase [Treponema sp.]